MAHVLVAIDGSRLSFRCLEVGRRIAGDRGHLSIIHAADEDSTVKETAHLQREIVSKCEEFALPKDRHDVTILEQKDTSFGFGMPLDKRLCAYVNKKMPTCFVMGIFGKSGPSAFSKGSKTDHAIRNSRAAVVVVKPNSTVPEIYEESTIVVGVRGTASMDAKLIAQCTFLLSGKKDKIILYHCHRDDVSPEEDEKIAKSNKALCKMLKDKKINFEFVQEDKEPLVPVTTHILKFAEQNQADTLVIGVDGMKNYRDGKRLLGSVTDKITTKYRGTVCLVRDRSGTQN
mmetsp:Transcript_9213/g.13413  ORF Transcript_9213/g.13413 Transcript_9213/m.13413 type:complete len:287 (-) Transcript_9213:87-947(-)|eukprot:CAMPEP_0195523460 /NCGR_PEP_ID=MMETSP0794_2-20130614/22681_1 /TAXON_ID=515487 /ORGANISM="Stephanopyxis turris, Strain CCMP 815" /LENGTH=286 /DNA_ID=CAMNT_0040653469 /DNA_START=62 /DNA_END=922 /DNA_ORIENTATION=+